MSATAAPVPRPFASELEVISISSNFPFSLILNNLFASPILLRNISSYPSLSKSAEITVRILDGLLKLLSAMSLKEFSFFIKIRCSPSQFPLTISN